MDNPVRLTWQQKAVDNAMETGEPFLTLTDDGKEILLSRRTAALYQFLGEAAVYDHIFVIVPNDEEVDGMYMFKDHSAYPTLVKYMVQNRFPAHLNLLEASEMDIEAFEQAHYGDIESAGTFPEEWGKNGTP